MYTSDVLLDIHTRAHRSLSGLLTHCRALPSDDLNRELADGGFGYPTLRLQFHHVLGAERYWIGVLQGQMQIDDDADAFPDLPSLETLREQVAGTTADYLRATADDVLSTPQTVTTFGDREVSLIPAHVVLRVSVHIYDHKGQVAAICRRLGHPIPPGLDFPLTPGG